MIVTYTKDYSELNFEYFTVRESKGVINTYVFDEYLNLIKTNGHLNKKDITELVKNWIPIAKSKLRISYNDKEIEFFKPNKYIFPQFYIVFK